MAGFHGATSTLVESKDAVVRLGWDLLVLRGRVI